METPFFAPLVVPCVVLATLVGSAVAQDGTAQNQVNPNPSWDDQWPTLESEFLSDYVQLTSETRFTKAGECYFSPDGNMVIFQGIPEDKPDLGPDYEDENDHYSMYVATVQRDDNGDITGLGQPGLVSTLTSANTCGWFNPNDPMTIMFGSTRVAPNNMDVAGYQRESSKYAWQFPVEMDIIVGKLSMNYMLSEEAQKRAKAAADDANAQAPKLSIDDFVSVPVLKKAEPLWRHLGYDAEGSWSPDGRFILYTRLEPDSNDGNIWVFDTKDQSQTELVNAKGYDGGPFFSPDGKKICYRSDRRGDNLLQVFVATLKFDDSGKITGIEEEIQLTDNEHVNWCPFWTPDGKYLLYASSEISHGNYEIYAIDASGEYKPEFTPHLRVTQARGFDGLPALSKDGKWMIWTAQRGKIRDGEDRPSSQVWAAKIDLDAIDKAYQKLLAESE